VGGQAGRGGSHGQLAHSATLEHLCAAGPPPGPPSTP
jgi:hypothetical protein